MERMKKIKTKTIQVTPLQEYLITWGLQAIRYESDGQLTSGRNLLRKLGDYDTKLTY